MNESPPSTPPAGHLPGGPVLEDAERDPVCGMAVAADTPHQRTHAGRTWRFCSARCAARFDADPARYATAPAAAEPTPGSARHHGHAAPPPPADRPPDSQAPAGTVYTCPMHPEIRQDHPGACPKCGMALEPELPSLEDDNPELRNFSRRFWWTLPLTVAVFVLAMSGHRLHLLDMAAQSWVELALSAPVVLWAGAPFFVRGWRSLRNRSPNMWTLISLGTGAAFAYSVVATLAPQAFPGSFVSMGRVAVYFEAAAVIVSLTLLGQVLELKARAQTSAAIK